MHERPGEHPVPVSVHRCRAGSRPLVAAMWRLLLVAAVSVVAVFGFVGPAQAHPTLLVTSPAADGAEAVAPSGVALVFNEPVTIGAQALTVTDAAGHPVGLDQVGTTRGGTTLTGRLTGVLPPGVYTVRWRATGTDGDLVESSFRFAVGSAIIGPAGGAISGGGGVSWPAAGLRWLLFAAMALVVGGSVGARITTGARRVRPSLPVVRSWIPAGAWLGLLASVGLAGLLVADTSAAALTSGTAGRICVAEAAAFATAVAVLSVTRLRGWVWLPVLGVAVAEGWRSHANAAVPVWGGLLTGVHLAAAAVWVGALAHVVVTAVVWRGQRPAVWWAVTGYARWAGWLFTTVVATGTVSALVLVPLPALATTAYGRLLLAKLTLVALAAVAAATARWWLRRRPHSHHPDTRGPDTLSRLVRATRVEAAALAGVLAVTALLVSSPPARTAFAPPAPPAPAGVVQPLGTLAGQIGVAVQASQGQLVVRLSAPHAGDLYAPTAAAQPFRLSAQLLPAGAAAHPLALRGCGQGCFTAPVTWATGDNVLTLRAEAAGWAGGTVSLLIPWPVLPAGDRLAAAASALRTAGPITVYEQVTSDTSRRLPDPTPLQLTGAVFLASQPYATGVAPQAVTLHTGAGRTRLALGYPAAGQWVQLLLDDHDRILEEQLSDEHHLIHRRFVYPDRP